MPRTKSHKHKYSYDIAEEIGSRSVRSKDAKEYLDNHLGLGSSEDDRSKLNNHNQKSSGDHNMGRPQNNWNNYPNLSQSPLPNSGFIPFHPVPPLIFNPVMQQFIPLMFGRPPINMKNLGLPFLGYGNPGKNDHSVQGPTDEVLSRVTETQIENEENQQIDVSKDLSEPEIYDHCKSMLNSDLASVSGESDCKILFLEEGPEADSSNGASLYGSMDDSIFKNLAAILSRDKT
nr:hypothetical protein [Tanacetum cinerariifolium]